MTSLRSCTISLRDAEAVTQTVRVQATSLYEADARLLAAFREQEWAAGVLTKALASVQVCHPIALQSLPMPDLASQREQWEGHPVELGDAWTLRKGQRLARCALFSHQFGWELRLMVGELVRSQVCRTQDEILTTQANWKASMVEPGWR